MEKPPVYRVDDLAQDLAKVMAGTPGTASPLVPGLLLLMAVALGAALASQTPRKTDPS